MDQNKVDELVDHIGRFQYALDKDLKPLCKPNSKKVLVLECGSGEVIAWALQGRASEVIGLSSIEKPVVPLEKYLQKRNIRGRYLIEIGLIENIIDIYRNYFDLIIAYNVFEYLENVKNTLLSLSTLLAPSGSLVISSTLFYSAMGINNHSNAKPWEHLWGSATRISKENLFLGKSSYGIYPNIMTVASLMGSIVSTNAVVAKFYTTLDGNINKLPVYLDRIRESNYSSVPFVDLTTKSVSIELLYDLNYKNEVFDISNTVFKYDHALKNEKEASRKIDFLINDKFDRADLELTKQRDSFALGEGKADLGKIKIVAIAKDEAAYLPAWIHHHLYFGFDEIDVYVNDTKDNSRQILEKISKYYPVNCIEADYLFDNLEKGRNFQQMAYKHSVDVTSKDEFSHILFIDIDEFWTPMNFTDSIRTSLVKLGNPDILSLEWVFKRDENVSFSRPYNSKILVNKNHFVKSIIKTELDFKQIEIHNSLAEGAVNLLGDGSPHPLPYSHAVTNYEINHRPIKSYYILHRLWRSQLEYISRLAQGMRQAFVPCRSVLDKTAVFKSNRIGYLLPENQQCEINFNSEHVKNYDKNYEDFIIKCNLSNDLEVAEKYIIDRSHLTLQIIRDNYEKDSELIKKITVGVDLDAVEKEVFKLISGVS